MSKETTGTEILQSLTGITAITKVIGHEKRLQILALVNDNPEDFLSLRKQTELQKTALSNHLTKLLEVRLIERIERGKYKITDDGSKLLGLISAFYQETKIKQELKHKEFIQRYSKGWIRKMDEKRISCDPIYQPTWISYLGAVSGIMKALGKTEHDTINVGGYTGYTFALPNVSKKTTCPSGPTALGRMWKEIEKGTTALGYKTRVFEESKSFPSEDGKLTEEDSKRAKKLFQLVKKAINNDEPVILWGIPIPEYGIVKGYQDNSYIVSTYRRLTNQPDDPIAFDSLHAPGCLHAIIIEKQFDEITTSDDRNMLNRAITLAEGQLAEEGYVAGALAYEEWAKILEKGPEKNLSYQGNSYVNECTLEAKALAAEFFKRLVKKYETRPFSSSLLKASEEFLKVVDLLKSFQKIFPFAFEGDFSEEKRKKGAETLRNATPHESQALAHMKDAYNTWKQ